MKVIIIKKKMNIEPRPETQEEEIKNTCPEAVETIDDCVKNIRRDTDGNITDKSIERSCQFNKAKAVRNLIMDMMALNPIITVDENDIPSDTYNAYVEAGNRIDKYFDNLMNEYIDRNESDDNCMYQHEDCPDTHDSDDYNGKAPCGVCNNLTHNCNECDEEAFENDSEEEIIYDEESLESEFMMDFFTLLKILKSGFINIIDINKIDEKRQFNLFATGKECNMIANILNKYEIEDIEEIEK